MPSRKRAKGKARKAAKEAASAKAKESQAAVAANQRQGESLEAQMQMLQISHSHGSSMKCGHGWTDEISPICHEFIKTFIDEFLSKGSALESFKAADMATALEKFDEVYSTKLESIVSILVAVGTESYLDGDNVTAQMFAVVSSYFEELIAVDIEKTKAVLCWAKVCELHGADEHTLASYYRKRIPCSCLDEKYEEVKSVKKIGWCCNKTCSLPGRKVERSKMLCCARCGEANYCSKECQKADWKSHKKVCGNTAEKKAAFKKQT